MFDKIIKAIPSLLTVIISAVKELSVNLASTDELSFNHVVTWFKNRKDLKNSNENNIAFSLIDKKGDNFVIIIGIFNKENGQILDAEKIVARQLDAKLAEAHENNGLVLYE
jgi:hypothetical protein